MAAGKEPAASALDFGGQGLQNDWLRPAADAELGQLMSFALSLAHRRCDRALLLTAGSERTQGGVWRNWSAVSGPAP
jgi:hypothetical protein